MVAQRYKILVLYYESDPCPLPQTLYDRIFCWRRDPRVNVKHLNVAFINKASDFNLLHPDIIILDTTLLRRRWNENQKNEIISKLRLFDFGVSFVVATPHDEHHSSIALLDILKAANCDLVLSCANARDQSIIYGEDPLFYIEQTLTTHISPRLRLLAKATNNSLKSRKVSICYRANSLQRSHGTLGKLKVEIGNVFKTACEVNNMTCDIKIGDCHRLKTKNWQKLLKNSQTVLGVPSGASILDPDGKLQAKLIKFSNDDLKLFHLTPDTYFDKQYKTLSFGVLAARHIEAALSYTPQILVRGDYNNLLKAGLHYIPIEPDFSNIAPTLEYIKDIDTIEAIADRTAKYVLGNPEFDESTYRNAILARVKNRPFNKFSFILNLAWFFLTIIYYRDKFNLSTQRLYQRLKMYIVSSRKSSL